MGIVRKDNYFSVEAYLEMEAYADIRHEYFDGEIFAMAGGSQSHSLIISNCIFSLKKRLEGKECRVYGDNMKLQIKSDNSFVYPDVHIHCGPPDFFEHRKDVITNSFVVFEVLSESTASFDRGGKFERYKKNPSIREYILIEQREPHVDVYRKNEAGIWANVSERYYGLGETFILDSLKISIPLAEIYDLVEFPTRLDSSFNPQTGFSPT